MFYPCLRRHFQSQIPPFLFDEHISNPPNQARIDEETRRLPVLEQQVHAIVFRQQTEELDLGKDLVAHRDAPLERALTRGHLRGHRQRSTTHGMTLPRRRDAKPRHTNLSILIMIPYSISTLEFPMPWNIFKMFSHWFSRNLENYKTGGTCVLRIVCVVTLDNFRFSSGASILTGTG